MNVFIKLLVVLLATVSGGRAAVAQPGQGSPGPGPAPCCNTFSSTGLQVFGTPVISTFAQYPNPIVSPETQNAPSPNAIYIPAPAVLGYAATAGVATYESMTTSNLTITGTVTNHYGMFEQSIYAIGGGTMTAELNGTKGYLNVSSGTTVNNGENFEANVDNHGTLSGIWSGYTSGFNNASGSTVTTWQGFAGGPSNNNSTGSTFARADTFHCNPFAGSGAAINFEYCLFNNDPIGEIANLGHWASRNDTNAITLTSCGSSPVLGAQANDDAGWFTTGSGATACTINFHTAYNVAIASAIVVASDGGAAPTYAISGQSTIVMSAARAGGVYQYFIMGGR